MKTENPKVYIVGAGPGDEGLLTIKGMKALKKADCVIYDFLANSKLLKYAKRTSEKICVGKSDGFHLLNQKAINRLVYEKSRNNKTTVRLKGGDPFIFSRGVEEALYLTRKGVKFEIIQGVTSAFASVESFGIPLTRKGKFSSVAVLTGRKSNNKKLDAPACDTLVYLMAVANIDNVVKAILGSGKSIKTPCAFIERGTTAKEKILTGNLGNIAKKAKQIPIRPPAVFIVGEVVNYGKKIYAHKYKKT